MAKRNPPLVEVAAESAPVRSARDVPAVTSPHLDILAAAKIDVQDTAERAKKEGLTGSNAYAQARVADLQKDEIYGKTAKLKQLARQKGYYLKDLIRDPAALQAALDEFDLACFDLGLYPIQSLVSTWLHTSAATIKAFEASREISEAGDIIAAHTDYCVSVISEVALSSSKPPVFSIYYLKSAHKMFDTPQASTITANFSPGAAASITISAGDISDKAGLFSEIDAIATDTTTDSDT